MTHLALGVSTWCFNALAPEAIRTLVDGGRLYAPEDSVLVSQYYKDIADAILNSEVEETELWHSDALFQKAAIDQLERLSNAGKIRSLHAPFNPSCDLSSPNEEIRYQGINACIRAADLLSDLDGKVLTVHGSAISDTSIDREERIRLSASSLAEIAAHCAEKEISIAVEILMEPNIGCTADELLEMQGLAGNDHIGFCVDVNHVFPPESLIPSIEQLGRKLITLHISDYDGVAERHWLPMKGIINWKDLYKTLQSIGYSGPFLYEARFPAQDIGHVVTIIMENYAKIKS